MFVELFILVTCLVIYSHYNKRKYLPPGPPSIPIFGSTTLLEPKGRLGMINISEKLYKYEDMYTLFIGPFVTCVIINNFQRAKDLFFRDEFSGRMKSFHKRENGRNLGIVATDGQTWTNQRRFSLKQLRDLGFGRKSLDSVMIEEVDEVIDEMIEKENVTMDSTFNVAIINVLWQIVASKRFDPHASDTKRMMTLLNTQFKAKFNPIMVFYWLRRIFPLEQDKCVFELKNIMRELIKEHLADIDYDNPRDFIDTYLKQIKENGIDFDIGHLVHICLDFFQAGAETSSTTLLWLVMLMSLHPEVQTKCQKEVDNHLGEKLPTIDEMNNLPYIVATLMEVQRFSAVGQTSLPHRLLQDVEVDHYKFKKGILFFSNLEKFMNDPIEFPEPRKFKPERFLDENGKVKKHEYLVPFGIGKRICMGDTLAKNQLFIFFARILQRINIRVTDGKLPDPNEFIVGITKIPSPYDVLISARSS